MRAHQLADPDTALILRLKEAEDQKKPSFDIIAPRGYDCKYLYSRWELLEVYMGVLCIRWIEPNREKLKIFTPRSLRDVVLWYLHDSVTSGHFGIRRTTDRSKESSYIWPMMRRSIYDYVRSCEICEERKNPPRKKRSYMKSYLSGIKFERIAIDIAGPFVKSDSGYSYILVVVDYFTKYAEIYPLQNMEAETVAEAVFKGWIKRFGCPRELHSDQGKQFESLLFQELCKYLQIHKTRTTPYHPRSDGLVERLNRTIKEMLSKYISSNQNIWDKYIDGITMAYNSTPHETTGITPYRMLFGTEMCIPLEIISENLPGEEMYTNESEYVRNMGAELEKMYRLAREMTCVSAERQKINYDKSAKHVSYEVGDLVRRHQKNIKTGTKVKLARCWTGPWQVIQRLSDVLYQIQHSKNSKPVIVHADNLKIYRGRKVQKWTPCSTTTVKTERVPPQPEITEDQVDSKFSQSASMSHTSNEDPTFQCPERSPVFGPVPQDSKIDQSPLRTRYGRTVRKPRRYRD